MRSSVWLGDLTKVGKRRRCWRGKVTWERERPECCSERRARSRTWIAMTELLCCSSWKPSVDENGTDSFRAGDGWLRMRVFICEGISLSQREKKTSPRSINAKSESISSQRSAWILWLMRKTWLMLKMMVEQLDDGVEHVHVRRHFHNRSTRSPREDQSSNRRNSREDWCRMCKHRSLNAADEDPIENQRWELEGNEKDPNHRRHRNKLWLLLRHKHDIWLDLWDCGRNW